jgi:hypothetical protein
LPKLNLVHADPVVVLNSSTGLPSSIGNLQQGNSP